MKNMSRFLNMLSLAQPCNCRKLQVDKGDFSFFTCRNVQILYYNSRYVYTIVSTRFRCRSLVSQKGHTSATLCQHEANTLPTHYIQLDWTPGITA